MEKIIRILIGCMAGFAFFVLEVMRFGDWPLYSTLYVGGAVLFYISLFFLLSWSMKLRETNMKNLQRIAYTLETFERGQDSPLMMHFQKSGIRNQNEVVLSRTKNLPNGKITGGFTG